LNKIIARCVRSGDIDGALRVFHGMRAKNTITWNSLLIGISKDPSRMMEAHQLFDEIPEPDTFSYNIMLSCYVRNVNFEKAQSFFDRMPFKDAASWNTMITGYARRGEMEKARELFYSMMEKNEVSWNAMISGYIECGDLEKASHFFKVAPVRGVVAWTAMITGYMKAKKVELAEAMFKDMTVNKNLVTWNAMISGYVENSRPEDGLKLFRAMLEEGIRPNSSGLSSALLGCSELSALQLGRQIHQIVSKSTLCNDVTALTSLISMYCKCGELGDAWKLFEVMKKKDVVAWNAMISGYAQHGNADKALCLFREMIDNKIRPDWITFVAVLLACNHAGLVNIGMAYFESMVRDYKVEPQPDHYTCMVDLLGRAGKLEEALKLIRSMPFRPHAAVFGTLLGACRVHKNVELAEFAAEKLLQLNSQNAAGYVQLANIYASKNRWEDVARVRKRMKESNVVKVERVKVRFFIRVTRL
jgi:pentatricopeptide repeat protein